jgi:hypothetical protein
MRHVSVVLIFALALGSGSLFARVGETLEQCAKRYGKAIHIPLVYDFGGPVKELAYYNFQKNGIAIQIGFLNGKASDLTFQHAPATEPGSPPPAALTQVEIDTLLAANSGAMKWTLVPDGKITFFPDGPAPNTRYGFYHKRDDGVMATFDSPALHIFTPEWMDYINAKMKARNEQSTENQKKNLEGF